MPDPALASWTLRLHRLQPVTRTRALLGSGDWPAAGQRLVMGVPSETLELGRNLRQVPPTRRWGSQALSK